MKYISIKNPREVEIKEKDRPVPGKGEALLKMLYGGICGSISAPIAEASPMLPIRGSPGHEVSARIEKIGWRTVPV